MQLQDEVSTPVFQMTRLAGMRSNSLKHSRQCKEVDSKRNPKQDSDKRRLKITQVEVARAGWTFGRNPEASVPERVLKKRLKFGLD